MAPDRLVMGIDLGTTNSCVGVWLNGRVEIVPSDQGTRTTPSCVAFTDSERLIGEGANHQVATNASNTVLGVKRLMGRSFSDACVNRDARYWPFVVKEGHHDRPRIRVNYLGREKEFSPEEISAMVLVKMKETAEAHVGRPVTDAVITVPAYFTSSQRQATKDAGVIAGLNVLGIISETTAAAVAYSFNRTTMESTVLVYHLGGGTLDVSLVHVLRNYSGLQLQVKATVGHTHRGGDDFTNNMVDYFVSEFKKKNPYIRGDISGDKKAIGRLRRSCEEEKKTLSTNPHITVEIDNLFEKIDFYSTLSRDKFEQLNNDLFGKCMEPIAKCLTDAKMDRKQVDDVVLVGGSTRIPCLQQLVRDFFSGKELCRNINADEAVAYGATVQAARLAGGPTGIQTSRNLPQQVLDITPFSRGIGILEGVGLMLEVIERYTTIPTAKETTFVKLKDSQSSVDIRVYEDERAMGKFVIPLERKTKVRFSIDQDGILHVLVSAQDKVGWITIPNLVGCFSTVEMKTMVEDAKKYKAHDEKHKNNVQARNDIQKLLYTITNYMKNLEDSAARLLFHQEPTRQQEKETPVPQDYISQDPPEGHSMTPPRSQAREGLEGNSSIPSNRRGKDQKPQTETRGYLLGNFKVQQENRKMKQPHKKNNKKLPDRIKKLQEIADGTTKWLENYKPSTSQIIHRKKKIEGKYQKICSQIDQKKQTEGDYHQNNRRSQNNCIPHY